MAPSTLLFTCSAPAVRTALLQTRELTIREQNYLAFPWAIMCQTGRTHTLSLPAVLFFETPTHVNAHTNAVRKFLSCVISRHTHNSLRSCAPNKCFIFFLRNYFLPNCRKPVYLHVSNIEPKNTLQRNSLNTSASGYVCFLVNYVYLAPFPRLC